ncbi:ABC transporter substrate-binding protein [Bradyrhizobium sp. DOA9]|uniref:ABC transporter substrate-binding protein n=1 Tax=Bradyrhizobium sp. DOA9 TaxID=1126627 RepID=UPI00049987DC|nr:ABC transporter substrate-binding protein [Bradyrhizobium sp. DOA9]GAJ37551.1 leucine-specific binding protein precursor [Bradyrhizobium sp. DOA9]
MILTRASLAATVLLSFASSAMAKDFPVGFFGPLSGPAAAYGSESLSGAQFALEEINAGYLGADKIKLIPADDTASPGVAAQAVQRMIDVDDVVAVVGGSTSAGTAAAIEVTKEAKVPQLSPLAVDSALTQARNPWFARIAQSSTAWAERTAEWLKNNKGARSAYLLARNDNFGVPLAEAFERKAKEIGLELKGRIAYEPSSREFKPTLASVASANPDYLVLWGYYTEAGLMAKQMAEMQIKLPFYVGSAIGIDQFRDIAGPAAEGTYGLLYYLAGSIETDAGKHFVQKWNERYHRAPTQYEGMGYDAMYVLAGAMKRAAASGGVTKQKIRDEIFSTREFQGATGPITILPNGDAERPLPMAELVGGKVKLDTLLH